MTEYYIDLGNLSNADNSILESMAIKITNESYGLCIWLGDRPVHYMRGSGRDSARVFLNEETVSLASMILLTLSSKVVGYKLPGKEKRVYHED